MALRALLLGAVVALAACAGDDGAGDLGPGADGDGIGGAGSGATDGDDDSDSVGDDGSDGAGQDGTDPGDDGSAAGDTPLLPGDEGSTEPGSLTGTEACNLVDVVISVDGSESMTEELEAMRNDVFPAFADRLVGLGGGLDSFRVATLDACPDPANFHTRGAAGECGFEGDNAWIDKDSPSIDAEFACVGDIYQDDRNCTGDNDDEQPISTIATALEEPWVSGDNAAFARDESLLIAIAITDEDEQSTADAKTADEIYDRLVATRGGDVRRIVLLGIGGGSECNGVYGTAEEAVVLRAVTQRFIDQERGVFWDLCEGRLEDGLEQAFQVIERACRELPPPGGPGDPPGDTPGDTPGTPGDSDDPPSDTPGDPGTPPPGTSDPPSDTPGSGTPNTTADCDGLDADCGSPPPPPPFVSSTSLLSSGSSIGLGSGSSGSQVCPSGTPVGTSGPGPD